MSHPLLTAPIGRSLLLLAGPTTALMLMQILVAVADGIFVGRLGTDALAGMALVVPFVTLMFNIANGGMGGDVTSAVARALGAGRPDDARAIVLHALVLAQALPSSSGLARRGCSGCWAAVEPLWSARSLIVMSCSRALWRSGQARSLPRSCAAAATRRRLRALACSLRSFTSRCRAS